MLVYVRVFAAIWCMKGSGIQSHQVYASSIQWILCIVSFVVLNISWEMCVTTQCM